MRVIVKKPGYLLGCTMMGVAALGSTCYDQSIVKRNGDTFSRRVVSNCLIVRRETDTGEDLEFAR